MLLYLDLVGRSVKGLLYLDLAERRELLNLDLAKSSIKGAFMP